MTLPPVMIGRRIELLPLPRRGPLLPLPSVILEAWWTTDTDGC